ncbi:ATP-dependent DNA helicase DinG [Brevibacillus sp. SYP-B805]|uniref:ATP-dependent DNA helicase DinG n=1 Tax=Brevibacillus sp. SYP-B805 TaxID=1578199 RepID=UPI0013EDBDA6|nr:ATP-dependent DNA helicase DinG [Brevibacillus sp. SYP-B805]NGQ94532.1 ATP-dependent DNA helicase DinG [Brevibacillus sp. SYP-B805]
MDRFIVVDLETTGSSPRQGDRIIQIGAVAIEDGRITHVYSTYVNPGQPIPAYITHMTGITDEMVADAPTLEEVLPDLLRLLDGRTFVAHNASFDLQFLQEALVEQGYYMFDGHVLDTVELARFLLPMQGSYRLVELADDLEIVHERPHQADSDALATAHLFLHLLDLLKRLPLVTIQRLQLLVSSFRSDVGRLLRQIEMEKLTEAALEQPAGDAEAEWDIYRQFALRHRGIPGDMPLREATAAADTTLEEVIERLMGEGAALEHGLPGFQRREAQEAMMRAIHAAIEEGTHLLVEAGTGTGKSLAYLVPAVLWAKQHHEQIVVSTNTIPLQEQLFQKEIPTLLRVMPFPFTVAKLKGRGNYLCLRKFEQNLEEGAESGSLELRLVKAQMVTWLTQTLSGDVEELNLPPSGTLFWQQVRSDANSCLHRQCPWFSRCYYFRAREESKEADLVVANHSLLMTDLENDNRILPSYQVAIIDEAHHLEEAATRHMGAQHSTAQLQFLVERMGTDCTALLAGYVSELSHWREDADEKAKALLKALAAFQQQARDDLLAWTKQLFQWVSKAGEESAETGRIAARYSKASFAGRSERLVKAGDRFIQRLLFFAESLEQLMALAKGGDENPPFLLRSALTDMRGLLDDVQEACHTLHFLLHCDDPHFVYWMEGESRTPRKHVYLFAAPLEVSQELSPLFANTRSVILTSATLTVKNSFSYLKASIGLDQLPEARVRTLALPSPFDYEKQGLLLIPSDFPALGSEDEEAYLHAVIQGCLDVIRAAHGRTLILFTSAAMLRLVYDAIKEQAGEEGFTLLGQGIDSNNRSKLVRKFQREPKAVLFGTGSFWEGVDIPGEALSALVIVRLPFAPPNHPVTVGRAEKLKEAGKNPFMSRALPQAVIQFKQGVGRLIRHQHDRGVVVVFDARIVESRYGRVFLQSLPPFQVQSGPWPKLRELIAPFLNGMPAPPDT